MRAGINAMKRAYPQYLAAGGETLPTEILQVIFPVDYWPLLQKYAKERGLDPYRGGRAGRAGIELRSRSSVSHANAYGLMQVLPSTGRSVRAQARRAAVLGQAADRSRRQRPHRHADLRRHDPQVRRRALRAGRLQRRRQPRRSPGSARSPGLPQDEFIDDIPFPETQNYVKRILGTAEDYRALYGSSSQ